MPVYAGWHGRVSFCRSCFRYFARLFWNQTYEKGKTGNVLVQRFLLTGTKFQIAIIQIKATEKHFLWY